ncbi:unnamed protein product [Thelazia callipaeda]|uniref:PI-PLC Y-box domain-containing protein n=1 Tax=Thelazia callipaeda TaxID=103827 RepID=A0A158RC86_THECL|nr:unnamed protein product [Thelazia callipaeda]
MEEEGRGEERRGGDESRFFEEDRTELLRSPLTEAGSAYFNRWNNDDHSSSNTNSAVIVLQYDDSGDNVCLENGLLKQSLTYKCSLTAGKASIRMNSYVIRKDFSIFMKLKTKFITGRRINKWKCCDSPKSYFTMELGSCQMSGIEEWHIVGGVDEIKRMFSTRPEVSVTFQKSPVTRATQNVSSSEHCSDAKRFTDFVRPQYFYSYTKGTRMVSSLFVPDVIWKKFYSKHKSSYSSRSSGPPAPALVNVIARNSVQASTYVSAGIDNIDLVPSTNANSEISIHAATYAVAGIDTVLVPVISKNSNNSAQTATVLSRAFNNIALIPTVSTNSESFDQATSSVMTEISGATSIPTAAFENSIQTTGNVKVNNALKCMRDDDLCKSLNNSVPGCSFYSQPCSRKTSPIKNMKQKQSSFSLDVTPEKKTRTRWRTRRQLHQMDRDGFAGAKFSESPQAKFLPMPPFVWCEEKSSSSCSDLNSTTTSCGDEVTSISDIIKKLDKNCEILDDDGDSELLSKWNMCSPPINLPSLNFVAPLSSS